MFAKTFRGCTYSGSVITIFGLLVLVACVLQGADSLKCYKCLNLECPEGEPGQKNEQLCQSARSFLVKSMSVYYEFGPVGYIMNCPARDETLQWTLLQNYREECSWNKAGCSLGRLQVITGQGPTKVISHATILGCMKLALQRYIKDSTPNPQICSVFKQNNTGDTFYFHHQLMLENCPKVTDICDAKDYCIPYSESGVRPFQTGGKDKSFEAGIIISIIAIILIVIAIALFASFCKNPLNRGANYSPAAQLQGARNIETPDVESPSTSKTKAFV